VALAHRWLTRTSRGSAMCPSPCPSGWWHRTQTRRGW
jgi:hypothetical protein